MSSQKIKILFRNRSLEMGGIEAVLLNILNLLDENKYEVVLLLNYKQGEFLGRIPRNIRLESIGEGGKSLSTNKLFNIIQKTARRLKYLFFEHFPLYFYRKYNLLDFDFEVAFSHYMIKDVLNSPNKKSKKIYWIHGDLRNSGFSNKKNIKFLEKMKLFDKGVFVSRHGKEIIEKQWNIRLKNVQIIYNALDISEISAQAKETVEEKFNDINYLAVGRLFWQKGFKDLVEAHYHLIKEGYDIKTMIIGDGIQRQELKNLISEYKIENSCYLYGYSDNPIKYINAAKFLVVSSFSESYPMVIGEALCLNKPVLSTDVGGISEMIHHNKNGLLFEPGQDRLYQTMKQVLDDKILAAKLLDYNSKADLVEKNKIIAKQISNLFK